MGSSPTRPTTRQIHGYWIPHSAVLLVVAPLRPLARVLCSSTDQPVLIDALHRFSPRWTG
ncbi:hypothetical protein [Blastococcus haudaquaticus]|uniref:hypothetical protein n=1 Tax=Blastococcus haudaquaticus TaxID=1938745 RepID=UPI000BE2201F|nr:hypothetical protein [Blastococcus haudaquaticus]